MTILMRPFCRHQTFGPFGLSAPAQGLCTCIKSYKNVDKIRGQSYFLKHATSDQSDKTFLLASKTLSPRVVSSCPGALYKSNNKIKYHKNNEAKWIFLELVQNNGNNKSFKKLPLLVPSGCMPMPWDFSYAQGLFSNDDPGLALTSRSGYTTICVVARIRDFSSFSSPHSPQTRVFPTYQPTWFAGAGYHTMATILGPVSYHFDTEMHTSLKMPNDLRVKHKSTRARL